MKVSIQKHTNLKNGLTNQQVATSKPNRVNSENRKSYKDIIKSNVCTLFNFINVVLACMVILTGSYRNMMFIGLVVINCIIGIIQEIRSKKVLDELALMNVKKATVKRNGKLVEIDNDDIVENDLLIVSSGDQMSVDAVLVDGHIECNESILTGESDSIEKTFGQTVMSGTIVVSGKATLQVVRVGEDTYSHSILSQAKAEKRQPSELRDSINTIIQFSTVILIPSGLILLAKQILLATQWKEAVLSTVAAVIGMIPEGLVLLTSTALAIGAMKLAREKVLCQELYSIETLARVDTLCLDKTGTITQGKMNVVKIDCVPGVDPSEIIDILAGMYSALDDDNATAQAIREYVGTKDVHVLKTVPFSSERKATGVTFSDGSSYVCGAYSFVLQHPSDSIVHWSTSYTNQGMRVLVLAKANSIQETLIGDHEVLGLICLQDVLRPNIQKTLNYFYTQDVDIKIISGDDPRTVAAIAKKAGVQGRAIDMTKVKDVSKVVETYSIFGRVTPEQKKTMVQALKDKGHTVAMTGDGVNDVMALKEADCSIAMGSGTDATKSVSSVVLLEDQFESLPSVLTQGRIVINNIQRSASLFLVKTLFSLGLTLITIFWMSSYPFKPIQLSLISSLGTGIPSFILTLEPNEERVKGSFLKHVFARAIPGAASVIASVLIASSLQNTFGMSAQQFSTICTIVATWNSLCVLYSVCVPMTRVRNVLMTTMFVFFVVALIFGHSILYLVALTIPQTIYLIVNLFLIPDFLLIVRRIIDKTLLKEEA